MAKTTTPLLPPTATLLREFGDRLRLARLRRRLTAAQVAERAGMAPMTLRGLERGGPGVTMGAYLAVMQVLGIERDLDLLAKADPRGRELQDARLPAAGRRSPRTGSASPVKTSLPKQIGKNRGTEPSSRNRLESGKGSRKWTDNGGFTSAETLARLIDSPKSPSKKQS